MTITAKEIADKVGGKINGIPDLAVTGPERIEHASSEHVTFLSNPLYESFLYEMQPGIVLVSSDFSPKETLKSTLIHVADVPKAVQILLQHYDLLNKHSDIAQSTSASVQASIHETAIVAEEATIGALTIIGKDSLVRKGCTIYPQVYVGNHVTIGEHTVIYPGVRIYDGCHIGDHCIIHANAVIGSDGFGYTQNDNGQYTKIPHLGNVIIEDEVEIGANTVVDRAVMGSTIIRRGAKLDNLIQIAHNVDIGSDTGIAAQAAIAGSVKIGKQCLIGGQVGIRGHIEIADQSMIQAQSGIMSSIKEPKSKVMGSPAISYFDYLKSYAIFRDLPNLKKEIYAIKKALGL